MFEIPAAIPAPRDLRSRLASALHQTARNPMAKTESVTALPDLSGLGGRWFESADGPGYVIESIYEPGHEHGTMALHRALSIIPARLAGQIRDPRLGDCPVDQFVYVDTETTGMGGAGSLVFLAGVARFEGGYLKLRQYLLPSPAYEGGLLGGVAEELASAGAFVSYNGKSFDIPMLETRYILSRKEPNLRAVPHLDLLHPNRRLFRGSFDSHRLVMMERELLGFERENDCPSAEVPARYFHFQRSGDPTHILPVLRHNAWDILSLVALAAHLAAVVDGRTAPLQEARATTYEGDFGAATLAWEKTLASPSISRGDRLEALQQLARCSARLGEWVRAAECWQGIAEDPRLRRVSAFVELAKIQEHKSKDVWRALASVDEALSLLDRGLLRPGPAASESCREALVRRQQRLAGKAARAAVPA